jgi:hypothetical protein
LEQIYQMICFEFSAEGYADAEKGAYFMRPTEGAPLLEGIADRICQLVECGMLEARSSRVDQSVPDLRDRGYVWRSWFRITPVGGNAWTWSEWSTKNINEYLG